MLIYQKAAFDYNDLAEKLWLISNQAYTHGSPWTKTQFLTDLQQPHTDYLIAIEANEIVGFLGFSRVVDEVEITNIAVDLTSQGKGHARQLLKALIQQEKANDVFQIFLEVRKSNERAKCLYESEKFRVLGIRKSYYQQPVEDAFIMSTKLKTETMK